MPAQLQWEGVPEFSSAILAKIGAARVASHDFVVIGLHLGEGHIKARAREGGRHAPGTPTPATRGRGPAVVSGTLGRSIRVGEIRDKGAVGAEGKVGPTAAYGRRIELEYGYIYVASGWRDTIPELTPLARRLWGAAVRTGRG